MAEEIMYVWGHRAYRNFLYFPLNFAANLEVL